jgi:hypothetical protein
MKVCVGASKGGCAVGAAKYGRVKNTYKIENAIMGENVRARLGINVDRARRK